MWIEKNKDLCMEFLRIYVGIGLCLKGFHFLLDQSQTLLFLQEAKINFFPFLISHFIMLAHFAGGIFLAAGFLTRIAALVQIPILLGAVFFVHLQQGLFTTEQTLEFTLLVLFLLSLFAIYGGGRFSVDHLLEKRHEKQHEQAS